MEFNTPFAWFAALGFLGTCFVLGVAGVVFVAAGVMGKRTLARWVLAGALAMVLGYFGLMIIFSLASHDKVLGRGHWKYFCELDCHEAYSVVDVKTAETLGPAAKPVAAQGTFVVVTIKAWFDERTISPHRGNGYFWPDPRRATVVDASGKEYEVSEDGRYALEQVQGRSLPLTQPLRPGESYTTTLVFDLPADAKTPRLYIRTPPVITWFLIAHENSPLHGRILFELAPGEGRAATL